MKAIRIINSRPSFYEIYSHFRHSEYTRYVFVDSYTFQYDQMPSDAEFEILDKNTILVNKQIILSPALIDQFGSRFTVTSNCIHVYDNLSDGKINAESILFKNLNWDWAYYCHDDVIIEIFIKNNHEDAFAAIKDKYGCVDIEFPGLITAPDGLTILD